MADIVVWPARLLVPEECKATPVPFTRSGGRSLGGLEPATRTDRGWWSITLDRVIVNSTAKARTWDAIRTMLGGRAGVIAVPAWSFEAAPYADGGDWRPILVDHSDGSTFSDGSRYRQRRIVVKAAEDVAIGATSIKLQIINAAADMVGVRFSYDHALYETGPATAIDGAVWTVPITPAVRAPIPAGADLEFDMPTCLCRLTDDKGMARTLNSATFDTPSVSFVEATDQWVSA